MVSAAAAIEEASVTQLSLQIGKTNAIGVYGSKVTEVKESLSRGDAPQTMFDMIAQDVLNDLHMDVFPRFLQSDFFKRYIRAKSLERGEVTHKDFTMLRMLGRGAFGAVYLPFIANFCIRTCPISITFAFVQVNACVKKDTGKLYASKCIDKRRVMDTNSVDNIMSERNLLAIMNSNFVCCLKYAVQDSDNLYLM